ncbi:MAG TPA: AAA family ATPase, partial [Mariniphaga anaerophila]|nr:AAA family ATPase [Mariniphaga anaerophila]
MTQTKTVYICQNCGAQSPKWMGKCLSCGGWNTFVEEIIEKKKPGTAVAANLAANQPLTLEDITTEKMERINVGITEFDRVLGGGIVPGSIVLLGGEPGIGKSTLVLQMALGLKDKKILYVSGEESLQQIKLRAGRLGMSGSNCLFLSETSLENVLAQTGQANPHLLIVDSIQTLSTETIESSPGSVTQVRECTSA